MPNLFHYEHIDTYSFDLIHQNMIYNIYVPKILAKRKFQDIQIDTSNTIFRLTNKKTKQVESVVVLDFKKYHSQDFYEVKYTFSVEKEKGFMEYLFNLITYEFNYHLISDEFHTHPGSMDFWLSLGRKKKYDLFIFNTETGYKRRYHNYPIGHIWGLDIEGDSSTKNEIVELMWEDRLITKEMYVFLIENIENIEDRKMIRLVCQKA